MDEQEWQDVGSCWSSEMGIWCIHSSVYVLPENIFQMWKGIIQQAILEWIAFPFSKGSSQPRDQTQASCIAGRFFTNWAIREAQSKRHLRAICLPNRPQRWQVVDRRGGPKELKSAGLFIDKEFSTNLCTFFDFAGGTWLLGFYEEKRRAVLKPGKNILFSLTC